MARWRFAHIQRPWPRQSQTVKDVGTSMPEAVQPLFDKSDPGQASTELSMRRTGLSFQRTRMSADRTLMSVIRTSLSLISFGFTIFQVFNHLTEKGVLASNSPSARRFGLALVYLGIAMVIAGIFYHTQFMIGLRRERNQLHDIGALHAESRFPVSFTLVIAILLLLVGVAAVASLTFHIGPFG